MVDTNQHGQEPRGGERPPSEEPREPRKSARSGDTEEQRQARDNADKPPAEGAAEDYDEDVPGSSEPPD